MSQPKYYLSQEKNFKELVY